MKKCKVTLAAKAKQRFFYLAPDAETLYVLSNKTNSKNLSAILKKDPIIEKISLEPEQWLEVEWNGCQNIHDGVKTVRVNCVRLIKSCKLTTGDDSDSLVSIHFGWILNDHLRFTNYRKNGMRVKMLEKNDEQYNFDDLFQDNQTIEDMIKELENIDFN